MVLVRASGEAAEAHTKRARTSGETKSKQNRQLRRLETSFLLLHLENCSVFSFTVCSLHCSDFRITKAARKKKRFQKSLEELDVI